MSALLKLARAGYEMEKQATEKNTTRKVGETAAGAGAGAVVGHVAGTKTGGDAAKAGVKAFTARRAFGVADALKNHASPFGVAKGTEEAVRSGRKVGGRLGAIAGAAIGAGVVLSHRKQAGVLLDTAKGIASVGANLIKQNPIKAAIGGAVAGAAVGKMTQPSQTKQAEEKKPYGALHHVRDAALTGASAYAGKVVGGIAAAVTSKHEVGGLLHSQRIGFGKGLGLAAGVANGVANAVGRREAHQKSAELVRAALKK